MKRAMEEALIIRIVLKLNCNIRLQLNTVAKLFFVQHKYHDVDSI